MTVPTTSTLPADDGQPELEIILSSRDGYVWASWPETNATIRLGRHETVAATMKDFLAQDALGRRLAGDSAS
jgi:hypothetical protein